MGFEGARACTAGAFHERNPTVQKTLGFDGNHSRKRAFRRFRGLLLVSLRTMTGRMLVLNRGSLW